MSGGLSGGPPHGQWACLCSSSGKKCHCRVPQRNAEVGGSRDEVRRLSMEFFEVQDSQVFVVRLFGGFAVFLWKLKDLKTDRVGYGCTYGYTYGYRRLHLAPFLISILIEVSKICGLLKWSPINNPKPWNTSANDGIKWKKSWKSSCLTSCNEQYLVFVLEKWPHVSSFQ